MSTDKHATEVQIGRILFEIQAINAKREELFQELLELRAERDREKRSWRLPAINLLLDEVSIPAQKRLLDEVSTPAEAESAD